MELPAETPNGEYRVHMSAREKESRAKIFCLDMPVTIVGGMDPSSMMGGN